MKSGALSPHAVGDTPFHCTDCGGCEAACGLGVEAPLYLHLARGRLMEGGGGPAAAAEVAGCFGVAGNPYGESLEPVLEARAESLGLAIRRKAEVVYHPGCATLRHVPDAMASVLTGISEKSLPAPRLTSVSAQCCGAPLAWAGDVEGFGSHATRFARALETVRTLILQDAACARTLRHLYPQVGVTVPPEIQSLAEVLPPEPIRDSALFVPCQLREQPGLRTGERALGHGAGGAPRVDEGDLADACCGGGALLPETVPSVATAMGREILEAFRATSTATWYVASSRCVAHLRRVDPSAPVLEAAARLEAREERA